MWNGSSVNKISHIDPIIYLNQKISHRFMEVACYLYFLHVYQCLKFTTPHLNSHTAIRFQMIQLYYCFCFFIFYKVLDQTNILEIIEINNKLIDLLHMHQTIDKRLGIYRDKQCFVFGTDFILSYFIFNVFKWVLENSNL